MAVAWGRRPCTQYARGVIEANLDTNTLSRQHYNALLNFLGQQRAKGNLQYCYDFYVFGLDRVQNGAGVSDTGNAVTSVMRGLSARTTTADYTETNDIVHRAASPTQTGGYDCVAHYAVPAVTSRLIDTGIDLSAMDTAMNITERQYSLGAVWTDTGSMNVGGNTFAMGIIDATPSENERHAGLQWKDQNPDLWWEVAANSSAPNRYADEMGSGGGWTGYADQDDKYTQLSGLASDNYRLYTHNLLDITASAIDLAGDEDLFPRGNVGIPGISRKNSSLSISNVNQSLDTTVQFFCAMKNGYDLDSWADGVEQLIAELHG